MLLAQTVVEVPLNDSVKTLMGLLGVLLFAQSVFSVANTARKLFGKRPPLHEDLANVRREFKEGDAALSIAINAESLKREQAIQEIQLDRARTLSRLHSKMNGINRNVYLIAGKLGVKPQANSDEEVL